METRDFFLSSASQSMVQDRAGIQGPFPVSEKIAARGFHLPSGLALTQDQIEYVCHVVRDVVR